MKGRYFFLLFIAIIISLNSVIAAVGISPGIYTIDFSPNLKQHLSFEFLGDSDTEMEIYASGEMAQYVKLSKKKIRGNGAVDIELNLPVSIDSPGVHTAYIGARPILNEEQGFGIVGNVKGAINIVVPYPGQYLLVSLAATNANAGARVNFTTVIENLGNEEVSADGKISVFHDDTRITDIDLGEFDLKSPDRRNVVKYLDTKGYSPGNYLAVAELSYGDNNVAEANSSFKLGELNVRITNYTRILERNKLNRFEIQLESEWNDPIDNVYADVVLQGYPVSFKTPGAHLEGFGVTTLTGFFDTTGIENSTFNALLTVHYADRTTQELVTIRFKKKMDYLIIGLVAAAIIILGLIAFVTYVLRKTEKKRRK